MDGDRLDAEEVHRWDHLTILGVRRVHSFNVIGGLKQGIVVHQSLVYGILLIDGSASEMFLNRNGLTLKMRVQW